MSLVGGCCVACFLPCSLTKEAHAAHSLVAFAHFAESAKKAAAEKAVMEWVKDGMAVT